MPTFTNEMRSPQQLRVNPHNSRTHSRQQINQLAKSIAKHEYISPLLIDEEGELIAGHGRLAAALHLQLSSIPVILVRGLTALQKRQLALSDNKISSNAGWNRELLAIELKEIIQIDDDIESIGFAQAEIDEILVDLSDKEDEPDDTPIERVLNPVAKRGDIWLLGTSRLMCGDARAEFDLDLLCAGEKASMAFLDAPYNRAVSGLVGRGKRKHREFPMCSGEMSREEFSDFLDVTLRNAVRVSENGAVHYLCMDWRSMALVMNVGEPIYGNALNLAVWVKSNGGQGSFYRSQHELIAVFQVGTANITNNVQLGKFGRNRTNVWNFSGVNSFRKGRLDELSLHPTVKPIPLVSECIKDCTRRGAIVLDTFSGSGSTLMASEKTGRRCFALEIDAGYVDATIHRWQNFTGRDAVHAETGKNFFDCRAE